MDQNAQIEAIISRLPPEQQERGRAYLSGNPSALPQLMPELSDQQIGNVAASRLGDAQIGMQTGAVNRAREKAQGSENELMAAISGPKYVPSAWGQIAVRQSPLMNVIKAVKAYRGGQDAASQQTKLEGQYGEQEGRLRGYLGATRDANKGANEQAAQSAAERIAKILAAQQGIDPFGGGY